MKILNKKEIGKIEEIIEEIYSVEDCLKDYVVLITGRKERIWITNRKIFELNLEDLRINTIGLYFGRIDRGELRVSIEGSRIIGEKATKNIVKIDKNGLWDFVRGFKIKPNSLEKAKENTYVLVKHEKDFVGVARLRDGFLLNCLPKSRKIKNLSK